MHPYFRTGLIALGLALAAAPGQAKVIEQACLTSGRDEANRQICGCIQAVADQRLTSADQRRAAKFFRNPELAHKTWISQKAGDDAFWMRWEAFGGDAEMYCAG